MKGFKRYLGGISLILVAYLVAQYYRPKPTNWTPTYLREDKIPYGLFILSQQIHDIFPETAVKISRQPVFNTLKNKGFRQSNYLIVGSSLKFSQLDYEQLMAYVKRGNNVFMASFDFGPLLSKKFKLEAGIPFSLQGRSKAINFVNPALKAAAAYHFDKGLGDQFFKRFDTLHATVLGTNVKGEANFLKYSYGKGSLYLLPNPQLLSNYNLINPRGSEYAAKALSYLPESQLLLWDEYNTRGNAGDQAILRVIFSHEQLRWAYYLALAGLLLFIGFEMKRRQRVIPILLPPANSSVAFVKVVGKVYYQERDHKDIAVKKISYFLEHLRASYRLKTAKLDQAFRDELVQASGVSEVLADELLIALNEMNHNYGITDGQLIRLNKLIEQFYKQVQ